ncbi:MAG: M60 family peptidase N-terminal accessory domain-containing protein [Pseudohongiellaceae bacterium]
MLLQELILSICAVRSAYSKRNFMIYLCAAACLGQVAIAQTASYEFSGNLNDASGNFPATNYLMQNAGVLNDSTAFQNFTGPSVFGQDSDNQYVRLGNDDFIGLPVSILDQWDANETIGINLRFKTNLDGSIVGGSPCCPNSIFRSIIATHPGDQRDRGIFLGILKVEERYELVLLAGDGETRSSGDLGEGYRFSLGEVKSNQWTEVDLVTYLNSDRPRIEATYNGIPNNIIFSNENKLIVAKLIEHLNAGPGYAPNIGASKAQLFLGGFPAANPRGADITLDIDKLVIEFPNQTGSASELTSILSQMTRLVQGQLSLDEQAQKDMLQTFFTSFGGSWTAVETEALAFLTAYESANEPFFPEREPVNPSTFSPSSLLAFYLQQWIFDNLFTDASVSTIAGVKFEAGERFPGSVSDAAPRITGNVQINGNYKTDPAILLNDQATVIRPTGFYAGPGELISITVPENAITAGLKIRIGIQRGDMEETWDRFNRLPRISNLFSVTNTTTQIANPLGGGIYFEVPDGSELGNIDVVINGGIKMPMFSTLNLSGHSADLAAFQAEVNKWHVPWFELHSESFSATLPMNTAKLYTDPAKVLTFFDSAFEQVNRMAGRPLKRFRPEWLAYDRWVTVINTALTASYPIYPDSELGALGVDWAADPSYASPLIHLKENFFANDGDDFATRAFSSTLWHEWGHLHNLPTLEFQELESNVHMLAMIVYNQVMEADIDTALKFSGFQQYSRDDAALDTMISLNWQQGKRLSMSAFDNEVRYQTRSWARLVDIAGMLGWDAVGKIHGAFYDRGVRDNKAYNYGITDDDFISTASAALNLNLAPVFKFWGVPPTAELNAQLKSYPVPEQFATRLTHYRSIAPKTKADFAAVSTKLSPVGIPERWNYFNENFDDAMSKTILDRIDTIQCEYYLCKQSNFLNGVLSVPILELNGKTYSLSFTLVDAASLQFKLTGTQELADSTSASLATFANNELRINELFANGLKYQVTLTLVDADQLLFNVTEAK